MIIVATSWTYFIRFGSQSFLSKTLNLLSTNEIREFLFGLNPDQSERRIFVKMSKNIFDKIEF